MDNQLQLDDGQSQNSHRESDMELSEEVLPPETETDIDLEGENEHDLAIATHAPKHPLPMSRHERQQNIKARRALLGAPTEIYAKYRTLLDSKLGRKKTFNRVKQMHKQTTTTERETKVPEFIEDEDYERDSVNENESKEIQMQDLEIESASVGSGTDPDPESELEEEEGVETSELADNENPSSQGQDASYSRESEYEDESDSLEMPESEAEPTAYFADVPFLEVIRQLAAAGRVAVLKKASLTSVYSQSSDEDENHVVPYGNGLRVPLLHGTRIEPPSNAVWHARREEVGKQERAELADRETEELDPRVRSPVPVPVQFDDSSLFVNECDGPEVQAQWYRKVRKGTIKHSVSGKHSK